MFDIFVIIHLLRDYLSHVCKSWKIIHIWI